MGMGVSAAKVPANPFGSLIEVMVAPNGIVFTARLLELQRVTSFVAILRKIFKEDTQDRPLHRKLIIKLLKHN